MLRLNNDLLCLEGLIASFKKEVIDKKEPAHGRSTPSLLVQLKTKLKSIYFATLGKNATDDVILATLEQDPRFKSDYPEFKAALSTIFSSNETIDKNVILAQLEASRSLQLNTEARARTQWEQLNSKLGYFSEASDLFPLFNALASASRVMIVLIEQNNAPDDTMAYTYAYRLMALFVDQTTSPIPDLATIAKLTEGLLKKMAPGKINTPYHDMLLNQVQLPIAYMVSDRKGWQQFIASNQENIVSALRFFAMAPAIEKQIKKETGIASAPSSLPQARMMAVLCSFARGAENPELALLCRDYNIPENGDECSFNKCLDYLDTISWPVKFGDSLPHPEIEGTDNAEGYCWVKLPTDDLRALILGRITGCCQNIGGNSENCVKDAVSLQENGLYVLLKLKPGHAQDSQPFTMDHSINYQAFEIVGQSYGWMSQNGNLTLDSLECSSGRVPSAVAQTMLTAFATQVLRDNPTIKFVTLGQGGGTPRDIGFNLAVIPEKIRSGYHYGDSNLQYCIAKTPFDNFSQQQRAMLESLLDPYPKFIKDTIDYSSFYIDDPENFLEQLKSTETIIDQLKVLRTSLLYEEEMTDYFLESLLENKDLIAAIQSIPVEQRVEIRENMLVEACKNNDEKMVGWLLSLDVPITERLIKRIDPIWAKKLIPSIEFILERLEHVENIDEVSHINRKKLAELVLSTFIEEANSESHDIVNEKKMTVFIKNKLTEINEQTSAHMVKKAINFKAKYLELKASYNRYEDDSGPSIYEID